MTAFFVVLALLFFSFEVRKAEWPALSSYPFVHKLPLFLAACSMLAALGLYLLVESWNSTHQLCNPQSIASLPMWDAHNRT